jgi:hypothetical protein
MTTIQEITLIVQEEVFNGRGGLYNRDQANEQLEIARTTDNLGVQVLSVLKVVNRFSDVTDPQIKLELMRFADTLRLIKTVNRLPKNADADHLQVMYDKAVETFKNR